MLPEFPDIYLIHQLRQIILSSLVVALEQTAQIQVAAVELVD
jgi:hypothetical protein